MLYSKYLMTQGAPDALATILLIISVFFLIGSEIAEDFMRKSSTFFSLTLATAVISIALALAVPPYTLSNFPFVSSFACIFVNGFTMWRLMQLIDDQEEPVTEQGELLAPIPKDRADHPDFVKYHREHYAHPSVTIDDELRKMKTDDGGHQVPLPAKKREAALSS